MEGFGFWICITVLILLIANNKGEFDKFITDKNFKKVKELEELRKLDNEVIKGLQKRLEDVDLDSSIG